MSGMSWGSFILAIKIQLRYGSQRWLDVHAKDDLVVASVLASKVAPKRREDVVGGAALTDDLQARKLSI